MRGRGPGARGAAPAGVRILRSSGCRPTERGAGVTTTSVGERIEAVITDPARLAAVRRLVLLDTGPSDAFDRLEIGRAHV